jgi:septin 2
MQDLQEVTHEKFYENYRSERLGSNTSKQLYESNQTNGSSNGDIMLIDKDKMLKEKEEELKKMQEMVAKMQAQMLQAQRTEQIKTHAN